jgi:hypothetical protein
MDLVIGTFGNNHSLPAILICWAVCAESLTSRGCMSWLPVLLTLQSTVSDITDDVSAMVGRASGLGHSLVEVGCGTLPKAVF